VQCTVHMTEIKKSNKLNCFYFITFSLYFCDFYRDFSVFMLIACTVFVYPLISSRFQLVYHVYDVYDKNTQNHRMSKRLCSVGHWVGDPCEFTSLSLHVLPLTEYKELQEVGSKYATESQLSFGMTAGFGSCAAQAYNQGTLASLH